MYTKLLQYTLITGPNYTYKSFRSSNRMDWNKMKQMMSKTYDSKFKHERIRQVMVGISPFKSSSSIGSSETDERNSLLFFGLLKSSMNYQITF